MDIQSTITKLVARSARCEERLIRMNRPLAELGIDMLALVELVMNLEAHFGIPISGDEALAWVRVDDIVSFVEGRAVRRRAS